ncbi:hypothetical protein N7491_010142 [Penicillium cf. griseofulvum]|uniref:Btz domain-containing protein n=1 Tax=Penicillium cf. griseofulvum TaxID=2972120 RepID=A0A9W9T5S4_9EURO|nr:hypothetical protein N7472_000475 [Penicillium cf. griseofulvum]KAJ5421697.1 hypothetical protein N7491_010142 [Penicillium cf. griseofulvum]KAJ5427890.1 hypothetical protein N7445_009344 [Penicillium cf. griseofulvum]
MAPLRRHIGASRRKRREEDGEEEGSMAGDIGDDSLSEGSVDSHQEDEDADGEVSEESEDEVSTLDKADKVNGRGVEKSTRHSSASPEKRGLKTTVSDTEAMLNGLKVSDGAGDAAEVHFDDPKEQREPHTGRTPSAPPTEPNRNNLASRKRRENDKYVKEREQNPAFVPTRGSFFLHDKRSTDNSHRLKSKSRPYGLIVDGSSRRSSKPDASGGQWAHDLHDTVAGEDRPVAKRPTPSAMPDPGASVPTAPRSSPPNRSFSSTTLVGNVPVVVSLPGMANPIHYPSVPKKLHTRLPQHRPPLRRDKPVRISLPSQPPRYIFPSVERSFIFIPRALRPNQVSRGRGGRGGGWYSGRRPSYYPNSSYTPSVVSRRSSFGIPPSQDGWPSPAGSVYSRPTIFTDAKPVVRLPPPPRPPVGIPPFGPAMAMSLPHPAYRESRPAPIPMHQPRPQKTVSVADIESPATFPFAFNPPQPQHEQPFHHQVPLPVHGPPSQPSATPLSQIPERAIHAPPFQPYNYPQPSFYPPSYPSGGIYYPTSGPDYTGYNGPVGPGASTPNFPGQAMPYSAGEQPPPPGTVAHESGGTVYFYDANHMYGGPAPPGPGPGPGGVVGIGGMMTPPGTTFYYPQQSSQYYGQ